MALVRSFSLTLPRLLLPSSTSSAGRTRCHTRFSSSSSAWPAAGSGQALSVSRPHGAAGGREGPRAGAEGLTLPGEVLLAVLRLLGNAHLGEDESGPVADLGAESGGQRVGGTRPEPCPVQHPRRTLTL